MPRLDVQEAGELRLQLQHRIVEAELHGPPIPYYLHGDLIAYIVDGQPQGHFLQAVISNDLHEACRRADRPARAAIWTIVFVLHNYAPAAAYGSLALYTRWVLNGGQRGHDTPTVEQLAADLLSPHPGAPTPEGGTDGSGR